MKQPLCLYTKILKVPLEVNFGGGAVLRNAPPATNLWGQFLKIPALKWTNISVHKNLKRCPEHFIGRSLHFSMLCVCTNIRRKNKVLN